jgi:hypothetical protein
VAPEPADLTGAGSPRLTAGLVQVELEALNPPDLHALFDDAIKQRRDLWAHRDVLAAERQDRDQLNGY